MDSTTRLSGTPPFFSTGQQIVWRYVDVAAPHYALTLTVVRDDADSLVAWLQAERSWTDYDVLRVAPTGQPWSLWVFFTQAGEHLGWYVNLEEVHRRDADTIYSEDRLLDLWVEPDRARERKDEAELEIAVEQERYTRAEADSFLADAARIEALIDAWGSPFCDGWETIRPDPAWTLPTMPPATPTPRVRESPAPR